MLETETLVLSLTRLLNKNNFTFYKTIFQPGDSNCFFISEIEIANIYLLTAFYFSRFSIL